MGADREAGGLARSSEAVTPTAAPTAAAQPGTPTETTPSTHRAACANCGAPVTRHYCAECGQRVEHSLHSLWHFIGEVTEDLTHADSRVWRTMAALLLKPGFLTREFLDGRRVSYLPPLRLYLVLSVLYFLVAAAFNQHSNLRTVDSQGHVIDPGSTTVPQKSDESPRQHAERACATLNYNGPFYTYLQPALRASCVKSSEDHGRGVTEAFMHALPRALFLAVPLLAIAMKPLYRRPRRYYVQHLLFLLHNHAFLFLLLGLFSLITGLLPISVLPALLGFAITLYIPYYYYLAMRRVYDQGTGATLGKLAVLALAYFVTGIFVLVTTSVYSVLAQ